MQHLLFTRVSWYVAASFLPLASHKSLVSSAPPLHILVKVDNNNVVDMDKDREDDMDEAKVKDFETLKDLATKDSKAFQQANAVEQACNSCEEYIIVFWFYQKQACQITFWIIITIISFQLVISSTSPLYPVYFRRERDVNDLYVGSSLLLSLSLSSLYVGSSLSTWPRQISYSDLLPPWPNSSWKFSQHRISVDHHMIMIMGFDILYF